MVSPLAINDLKRTCICTCWSILYIGLKIFWLIHLYKTIPACWCCWTTCCMIFRHITKIKMVCQGFNLTSLEQTYGLLLGCSCTTYFNFNPQDTLASSSRILLVESRILLNDLWSKTTKLSNHGNSILIIMLHGCWDGFHFLQFANVISFILICPQKTILKGYQTIKMAISKHETGSTNDKRVFHLIPPPATPFHSCSFFLKCWL